MPCKLAETRGFSATSDRGDRFARFANYRGEMQHSNPPPTSSRSNLRPLARLGAVLAVAALATTSLEAGAVAADRAPRVTRIQSPTKVALGQRFRVHVTAQDDHGLRDVIVVFAGQKRVYRANGRKAIKFATTFSTPKAGRQAVTVVATDRGNKRPKASRPIAVTSKSRRPPSAEASRIAAAFARQKPALESSLLRLARSKSRSSGSQKSNKPKELKVTCKTDLRGTTRCDSTDDNSSSNGSSSSGGSSGSSSNDHSGGGASLNIPWHEWVCIDWNISCLVRFDERNNPTSISCDDFTDNNCTRWTVKTHTKQPR